MKKKILRIVLFIISLIGFLYSQNYYIEISNYVIIDNEIPSDFNGYKIVQISDYHNENNCLLNDKLIQRIEKENPNIIVITGDLIDSSNTNIDQAIKLIDNIKEIAPIYFITGNHETWTDDYIKLKEELEKRYVKIINNESIIINRENSRINLIGVEDSDSIDILETNLELSQYNKDNYSILLSHRPELFNIYVDNDIDLVLTGHAHGGQIRFFNQGLVAPNQGLFPKYTSGIYNEKETTMVVSQGIGNSIIPIRFNNHPELVIITLKNK